MVQLEAVADQSRRWGLLGVNVLKFLGDRFYPLLSSVNVLYNVQCRFEVNLEILMHPKLNLICRILDTPEISKLTNGEYRTNIHLNTNGGQHQLEIISESSWAENIELKKIFQLELDVTMTNDHILIFQNPIWKYL